MSDTILEGCGCRILLVLTTQNWRETIKTFLAQVGNDLEHLDLNSLTSLENIQSYIAKLTELYQWHNELLQSKDSYWGKISFSKDKAVGVEQARVKFQGFLVRLQGKVQVHLEGAKTMERQGPRSLASIKKCIEKLHASLLALKNDLDNFIVSEIEAVRISFFAVAGIAPQPTALTVTSAPNNTTPAEKGKSWVTILAAIIGAIGVCAAAWLAHYTYLEKRRDKANTAIADQINRTGELRNLGKLLCSQNSTNEPNKFQTKRLEILEIFSGGKTYNGAPRDSESVGMSWLGLMTQLWIKSGWTNHVTEARTAIERMKEMFGGAPPYDPDALGSALEHLEIFNRENRMGSPW